MDEIASVWINSRLDLTGVERDLKSLDNKNYSLKVSVDDDALTRLNKHLDLKVKHFRQVNQILRSEKLKIHVDDSELSKINKIPNTTTKEVRVNVKVNQSLFSIPSVVTQKIEFDTSGVESKLNAIQSQIAKQSSSNLFSGLLLAPLKFAASAIGSILQGVIFAATAPLGEDIGRGIKEGIQKESGSIIGSFEFVSKKIAENLSSAIVDALEGDADKIREVLKIVGNYDESDLIIENRRQSAQATKKEQKNRNLGISSVEEARLNIAENRPQFEARRVSLIDKRNELAKNYQKIQSAMARSMETMGGAGLQKEIDKLSADLQSNLQKLASPGEGTDFAEISKISTELTREIARLTDRLGGVAERVKEKYKDFIHVLDNESKTISSEERKLINDLAPLSETEYLNSQGIQANKNIRQFRQTTNKNVPDIYQHVFDEVIKSSGTTGKVNIPELVVNPNLSAATLGKYSPEKNQIQVTNDAYQQILSGDVTKVSEKFFEILVHELRHAAQFDFGNIDAFKQRPNIELTKPTANELANLGGRIELSTATTQGVSPRRVRELETDAYVFAERNAQRIRSRVAASQFQQDMGVGGGRIQNLLKIENAQSLSSFRKVQQIAESYAVDISSDIEKSKQNIKSRIDSIQPLLEKAAQVDILPLPEINQLSQTLLDTYYKIVSEIQSEVSKLKAETLSKISTQKQTQQSPVVSKDEYRQQLDAQFTSNGLRQVVKRLGVTNNVNRKKDDLIEIITQANNKQVEEIIKSLGDSIKRTKFKTNQSTSEIASTISIDSFKTANRQIQVKLKELKVVSDKERQQIVESLVIDLNKQINEIDKINETTNLSGKQSRQLGGLRSYFEQVRQPLSAEFIKNNSLNLPITQRNNQGELSGVGDIEEFLQNIFERTTGTENTDETIRKIVEKFQVLSAKFNISEEKFKQLEDAINERYETLSNGNAKVKNIDTVARNKAMQSPDIQNDPEARFFANSANFQRASNRFDAAESSINSRYFAALGGTPIPPNVPPVINKFKDSLSGLKTIFDNIPPSVKTAVSAFTGLFGISAIIPVLKDISSESLKVAAEFQALEQRLSFASGSKLIGESQSKQLRSQSEYLGLNQANVLEQSSTFLASARGTPIEGQEGVKGLEALNQASRVYNLSLSQQQRSQVALQQIVGKGIVQQEELRGQLSEALPGATQIAARAYGVTTQELNRMVRSGLDSVEFFQKFTQQLGIETSGGVAGALGTTQAKLARFDSNLLKLQETFGKMLLPIQNMGLDILSSGLNTVVVIIPTLMTLVNTFVTKTVVLASISLLELVGNLIKSKVAMTALGNAASAIGSKIALAGREFLGFAIIGVGINNLLNQFKDLSGELRTQINSVKTLQSEYQNLVATTSKIKPVESNDFDVFKKRLGYAIKEPFTGEVKSVKDSFKVIDESIGISKDVINSATNSQTSSSIAQIKQLEEQINAIQTKKRALAVTNPGDKEGFRKLGDEESRLLAIRTESTKLPDNVRKQLFSQSEAVKAQLEYLQKLKKEFPLYGDQVKKVDGQIVTLTSQYDELLTTQENLVKSVGEGASAFSLMQRNIKSVADSLSDVNDKNQIATNLIKENLAKTVTSGRLSPQQEGFRNQSLDIELKNLQAKLQLDAIRQTQALLNTPQNIQRMQSFGVTENTGRAQLGTLIDQSTNVQDKFVFEQLSALQSQKLELSNLRLQVADAKKQAYQQLVEVTKQVSDYYRGIERQSQEQALEIKKLSLQTNNLRNQNRIKSIFNDGFDTIIGSLVEGIESAVNSFSSASEKAIDSQLQVLQSSFGKSDAKRSGIEISRSIPNLPPIKVDLDFSSIPDDNNVAKLGDTVTETIGGTENLGKSILDVAGNTEELNRQLLSNIVPVNDIKDGIEKSNIETQKASELSNQWNNSISPIPNQITSVNDGFTAIFGTMGSLITRTTEWIASLFQGEGLLANIIKNVGSLISGQPQDGTQGGGNIFQQVLGAAGVGKPINTGGYTILDSSTSKRIRSISDVSIHHPSRGARGREGNRSYADIDGLLEEVTPTKYGNLIKRDFVIQKNGSANVDVPAPVSGKVSAVNAGIGRVNISDDNGVLIGAILHMKDIVVKVGDFVQYGQKLGTQSGMGAKGQNHYGTHVHAEVAKKQMQAYLQDLNDGVFDAGLNAIPFQGVIGNKNIRDNVSSRSGNTTINISSQNGISRGGNLLNNQESTRLTSLGKQLYSLQQNPNILAFADAVARAEGTDFRRNSKNFGYSMMIGGEHDSDFSRHPFAGNNGSRIQPPRHNSTASGRYQAMDFNYSLTQVGRQFGRGAKSTMSSIFQGENPGSFSPAVQDLYFIASLKERGVLDKVLRGDFAGALQSKNLANHYASLQAGSARSAHSGQGTPEGQLRNTIPFAQQRLQARLREGNPNTIAVSSAANNFRAATPQQLSQTAQYGTSLALNNIDTKSIAQQQQSLEQQRADSIAAENRLAKVKRDTQKSIRDSQDANINQRRNVTDLQYEGIAFPTVRQENIKASTDNLRKYQDSIRELQRRIETQIQPTIDQADKAIAAYKENLNDTSLTPEARKSYQVGLEEAVKLRKQSLIDKSEAEKTIAATTEAFTQQEKARASRSSFDEQLRRYKENINLQQLENGVLQQRIAAIEQIKQSSPTDPRVENLPAMREELAINSLATESFQKRLDAEEQFKRNTITESEYRKRIELIEDENNVRLRGIGIVREREELEQTIAQTRRELEITSKSTDIQSQLNDASIKANERSQRLNSFGIDTGELAKLRTEQATNQQLILETDLKKQIIDIQEYGKQNGLTNEQVTALIYSLQDLNQLKLDNLKDELSDTLDTDKLNEYSKVIDNLSTKFGLLRTPILNLRNAQADRYEQQGGNVFVANASRRRVASEQEMFNREQSLMQFDRDVFQAKIKGIEIPETEIEATKNSIIEMSNINLGKLTDQFKDVRTSLGDIAKQGIGELSSGLSSLIAKGGSLGDVMNNVFGNILDKALNLGISSLFGGLFGGLFATGGIAGKAGYESNFVDAIANAAQTERAVSGRNPVLIMAHEGELMIPAQRLQELSHMGIGANVLLGRDSISNYAFGGVVGESSREYGRSISSRGGSSVLQVEYKSTEIAGQKYVTESDFQQGLLLAAEEGGKRGASIVTNKLTNSPSYRRSLGF